MIDFSMFLSPNNSAINDLHGGNHWSKRYTIVINHCVSGFSSTKFVLRDYCFLLL